MKNQKKRMRKVRRSILSQVQNPDDLEIGELIPSQSKGSRRQLVKTESPDDLEIADDRFQK